jgi:hypothetical protein
VVIARLSKQDVYGWDKSTVWAFHEKLLNGAWALLSMTLILNELNQLLYADPWNLLAPGQNLHQSADFDCGESGKQKSY